MAGKWVPARMRPEPMPSSCPRCSNRMIPVLTRKQRDPDLGPLPAEVPVTMVRPDCTPAD
jgi:hypothetical protein